MKVECDERVGVICGYNNYNDDDNYDGESNIIMAISENRPFKGWHKLDFGDIIETNTNNPFGHYYV